MRFIHVSRYWRSLPSSSLRIDFGRSVVNLFSGCSEGIIYHFTSIKESSIILGHLYHQVCCEYLAVLAKAILIAYHYLNAAQEAPVDLILVTNPRTGELRESLKDIYKLYVEYVVKNPLYTPGTPIK
ncbi:Trafficking protein particle complex subunit 1 [Bienertia sinuspersici]